MSQVLSQFLKIVFLFLTIVSTVHARGYENIFNVVEFSHVQSVNIDGVSVFYHGHSEDETNRSLHDIYKMSQKLKGYYPESKICKDITLHVYSIDFDILNNREVSNFLSWSSWGDSDIDAVYDARYSPSNTSAIFISTRHAARLKPNILAHEVTHYWQHTRCMSQSEDEAREFAELYITGKT